MIKLFSKNHTLRTLTATILLLGGGLFAAAGLTSCENFLNGGEVRQEIEEAIAYSNAKEITVQLYANEGTGSTLPSGNYTAKQGYAFEISFSENPAYSFIKWTAVLKDDSAVEVTEGITFEDKNSPVTKVKITNDTDPIKIIPLCEKRIEVSGEPSPRYEPLGVSRDRSISVSFTKALAESSFFFEENEIPSGAEIKTNAEGEIWAYVYENQTYLKNITITNIDDYSIAQHFTCPEISDKLLTIAVDKTNPIEFNSGEIYKTVKVTLSKDITDTLGIKMNSAKSWNYQITESTDEKATVILGSDKGTVYLAGTKNYSIGQKITLAYTEDADYQFVRWDYDSSIIYIEDPNNLNTVALVREKTTEEAPTQIKAVCAPRLRVTSFSPVNDSANPTVCKNSSIVITFSQNLPSDEEGLKQLENISITVGGSPVKSSFKAPAITENTVTFVADNSNMLDVPAGQTKTVSVSVPADFCYKLEDGTKVTYGGNGRTFDYKIDASTLDKAEVTFTAASGSGTLTAINGKYSIGQEISVSFTPANGWKFNGWNITAGGMYVDESKIKIVDKYGLSTKIVIYEALQGVIVSARTSECLDFTETLSNKEGNCQKDTPIEITFNQPLAEDCASLLDKIEISSDVKLDSFYGNRILSADRKKITIENTSPISVPKGSTKTITVTVPSDFYYMNDGNKINLEEKSFRFTVDHNTIAKTKISYKIIDGESETGASFSPANVAGTILNCPANNYGEYNIGEEISLSFDAKNGYQFYGWEVSANQNEVSFKDSTASSIAPTLVMNKAAENITVSAICYKRPVIVAKGPYRENLSDTVEKNRQIDIEFDHRIDSGTENEIIISYSVSGFAKSAYYNTSLNSTKTKITLKSIQMLPLEHAYETVTVTVPCEKVYYLAKDGKTKITPANSDYSWSYRVNNTTIDKTKIRMDATNTQGKQIKVNGDDYSTGDKREVNMEQSVSLEYPVPAGYTFSGWKIETDSEDYLVSPSGYVSSGVITVSKDNKEYCKLTINEEASTKAVFYSSDAIGEGADEYALTVYVRDVLLPKIEQFTPDKTINASYPKDATIQIKFNKPLANECSSLLDKIKILMDGNNVDSFYNDRSVTGDTIKIGNTKLLDVVNGTTKNITVTVPAVFYYKDGSANVYLQEEESFDFTVNSATTDKTRILFDLSDISDNSNKQIYVDESAKADGFRDDYNRGDAINLEYKLNTGYKFIGWKVIPISGYTVDYSGYISNGSIKVTKEGRTYLTLKVDPNNPTKAVVQCFEAIKDGNSGVTIYAKNVVCPVVDSVKINNTTNIDNVQSTSCDSKIYINFSKPINTDTATLSRSGSINITKFGSSNSHYETYFNTSWSSDNKQLILSPKNIVSSLVPDESNTFTLIISLNANKKEIKDTEGCSLIESAGINNSFDISYTVNGVRETTKPVFYNTQYLYDKEASATRKTLYATAFSSWGSTDSYYTTNHIKDSVYFNMYGYDADSGLKALRITETYYKTVAGENTSGETKVKEYTSFAYSSEPTVLNGIVVYRFSATHKLLTDNEGVIKLDFQLIDNAGNASLATTYYVIKDVSITAKIKFNNWKDYQTSFRTVSGTTESITLTPLTPTSDNKQKDIFYSDGSTNYSTEFNISSIKYGYSKDSITNSATNSGKNFTFTHDVTQVTYVSITYSDGVGNSKTILRAIPCKPVWDLSSCDSYPNSTYNYRSISIGSTTGTLLDSLEKSLGADNSYLYKKTLNENNSSDVSYSEYSYCYEGKNYKIYPYHGFYFDGEYWTSVSDANKYLYVSMESDVTSSSSPKQFYVYGENSSSSTLSKPANMPSYIDLKVTPIPNSGLCKVYVVDNLSSSYTWTYIFTEQYSPFTVRTFDSRTAYLPSRYINTTYNLKLKATNSSGATWTSGVQSVKINYQGSTVTSFDLDSDTTPPHFPDDSNMWTEPSQIYSRYKMEDDTPYGKGMYTNEKGLGEFTYYFIPSKTTSLAYSGNLEEYSLEELNAYTPHTTTYEIGKKFKIPFLDLAEGKYTSYIVAKDSSGNTVTKPMLVFNKLMNKSVKYEIVKSSDYYGGYGFIARFDSADEAKDSIVYSYRAYAEGQWVRGSLSLYNYNDPLIRDGYVDISTDYYGLADKWFKIVTLYKKDNSSVSSGYYYTDYMYPSYYINKDTDDEITCKTKNIVSGGYGFQIFCDAPTFAHVVYYPSKLTQTNKISDIPIWETKGCEENFILSSENFTYGEDQFELIPEGMYYAVIVHFADGSKAMSEIKQK